MSLTEQDFARMYGLDEQEPENPRARAGGNNPPETAIDRARNVFKDFSAFLTENPVIEAEPAAREAAEIVTRGKHMIAGLETERRKQTDPLNERVKAINATYKKPRDLIEKLTGEVSGRLTAFMRAEEAKRAAIAEAKRAAVEEAERIAREAEAREREAKENASLGEVVNVSAAIVEADQAFDQFTKTGREAARAEKDVPVRLGTDLGRTVSMKTKETLLVENWQQAIEAMGLTDNIRDAILTAARAYRKLHDKLPAGVTSQTERSI